MLSLSAIMYAVSVARQFMIQNNTFDNMSE